MGLLAGKAEPEGTYSRVRNCARWAEWVSLGPAVLSLLRELRQDPGVERRRRAVDRGEGWGVSVSTVRANVLRNCGSAKSLRQNSVPRGKPWTFSHKESPWKREIPTVRNRTCSLGSSSSWFEPYHDYFMTF